MLPFSCGLRSEFAVLGDAQDPSRALFPAVALRHRLTPGYTVRMTDLASAKQASTRLLAAVAVVVEFGAAAVIAVVAVLAVLAALRVVPSAGRELMNATGRTTDLEVMISDLLLAFIAIELMRIALAYIRRVNVLPTVIEAGLVAVTRQVVLFHATENVLAQAAALATLALALGLVWYLLARSGAMTVRGVAEEFLAADEEAAAAGAAPASPPPTPAASLTETHTVASASPGAAPAAPAGD